ncbi:unnamed protein product [Lathyrus oleraceus]
MFSSLSINKRHLFVIITLLCQDEEPRGDPSAINHNVAPAHGIQAKLSSSRSTKNRKSYCRGNSRDKSLFE